MTKNKAFYVSIVLGTFWLFSSWKSVYPFASLAMATTLVSAFTWKFLDVANKANAVQEAAQDASQKTEGMLFKAMCWGLAALATVSIEWAASRAFLPASETTIAVERVICKTSRGNKTRSSTYAETYRGKYCLAWEQPTRSGRVFERIDPEDVPGLAGVPVGGSIGMRMTQQDSLVFGRAGWYRI